MKQKTILTEKQKSEKKRVKRSSHLKSSSVKNTGVSKAYTDLVGEGHEDFYNYLDWLGFAKRSDLLVLTSNHHYYFEADDLKSIKSVASPKRLNYLKNPKDFLKEIYFVLPLECHFIGCFVDNRKQSMFAQRKNPELPVSQQNEQEQETGPWNSFLNMIYGIIDPKTYRFLSEKSVKMFLEATGFKVLDMTEFNGTTYFCAQKDNSSVE
jgi:hypothetical protein